MWFEVQLPGFVAVHHHTCTFQLITQLSDTAKTFFFSYSSGNEKEITINDNDNKIQWFTESFGEAKIHPLSKMILTYESYPHPFFEIFINKMYSPSHLLE